jgi:hypothetical protein
MAMIIFYIINRLRLVGVSEKRPGIASFKRSFSNQYSRLSNPSRLSCIRARMEPDAVYKFAFTTPSCREREPAN